MNKKILNRTIFSLIFLFFTTINAECGSFRIQENYFADNLIGFYLNSIDVNTGDSSIEYFLYQIVNEDYEVGQTYNLNADYKLSVNSPDLGLYGAEIISGTVNITDMSVPSLQFSNLDLNYESTGVPGADFKLEGSVGDHIQLSNDELINIQQQILQSGKLPNGNYIFTVSLKCSSDDNIIYDSITKTIEAYEPTFLDLITPGGSIQDTLSNIILSTNPLFTWNADYCSQCDYGIRVCKYDPSLHSSLSDAINDNSMLPSNQSFDFYPMSSNQSFSYPSSDAFDLIPGDLYVWQIQQSYETTLGIQENKSPIFIFKIYSIDNEIEDSTSNDLYSDLLTQLLGYQYEQLFGNNGQLKGFSVKGNTILLNNEIVPISVLYDIVNQLNNGNLEIIEVEVE